MSGVRNHPVVQSIERATALTAPATIGITAAAYALDAYNHTSVAEPVLERIPGVEHSSSMAGSLTVGAVVTAAAELVATRLQNRGREVAAERVRRIGLATAWVGSAACQAYIETSTRGVGDKWDVVAGLAATVPGIITGRVYGRMSRKTPDIDQSAA